MIINFSKYDMKHQHNKLRKQIKEYMYLQS